MPINVLNSWGLLVVGFRLFIGFVNNKIKTVLPGLSFNPLR